MNIQWWDIEVHAQVRRQGGYRILVQYALGSLCSFVYPQCAHRGLGCLSFDGLMVEIGPWCVDNEGKLKYVDGRCEEYAMAVDASLLLGFECDKGERADSLAVGSPVVQTYVLTTGSQLVQYKR